jgi:hypothetical protein
MMIWRGNGSQARRSFRDTGLFLVEASCGYPTPRVTRRTRPAGPAPSPGAGPAAGWPCAGHRQRGHTRPACGRDQQDPAG